MKYSKIIFLQVGLILFSQNFSFSQAASIPIDAQYQDLENDFKTEEVSKVQLQLFQKKSTQKVQDLLSTSELLIQKDLDSKFKDQLIEQGLKSFSSPTDSIFYLQKNKWNSISVLDFLRSPKKIKSIFPSFDFSNFKSSSSIFNDKNYSWDVSFEYSQSDKKKNTFTANCILTKEEKLFGDTKKEVWQVLITEIKEEKTKEKQLTSLDINNKKKRLHFMKSLFFI